MYEVYGDNCHGWHGRRCWEECREFENSDILRKEVWPKDFSATDIIYFSAQEEDVENKSEFWNSDNLKKRSKSLCPLIWSKKPLCYSGDLK